MQFPLHYRSYWLLFLVCWKENLNWLCTNGIKVSNFPTASLVPIKLAPVYNSVFHIQMSIPGQGENINKRVFERLCQVKELWEGFHATVQCRHWDICEHEWSDISIETICSSCHYCSMPITWPHPLGGLQTSQIWGMTRRILFFSLWYLMHCLLPFFKK